MTYYYADAAASDDLGAGTTWATAKQSIQSALELAAAGDSVFAKGGQLYNESVSFASVVDATESSPCYLYLNATGANSPDGEPFTSWDRSLQAEVSPATTLSASYQWNASGGGTNEYYLTLSGGGNPSLSTIGHVRVGGTVYREVGAIGSLANERWGWGDGDTLGFDTVYIRSDSGAPTLTDCRITVNGQHCVHTTKEYWKIYGGDCHDGSDYGILVDVGSTGVDCYGMDLHHNNFHGHTSYVHGTKMYYCRSYRNAIKGFQGHTSSGLIEPDKINYFYNCTSYDNQSYGFAAYNKLFIRNCISAENGAHVSNSVGRNFYKQIADPSNLIDPDEKYNCWYSTKSGDKDWNTVAGAGQNGALDSTSIEVSPEFVDYANGDVNLKLISPCRLTNADRYALLDFVGKPVGAKPDMGCLEHESLATGSPSWNND